MPSNNEALIEVRRALKGTTIASSWAKEAAATRTSRKAQLSRQLSAYPALASPLTSEPPATPGETHAS